MSTPRLSRRALLGAAATLPLVSGPLSAAAPMLGAGGTPFHRFRLGAFEVTTLLAGTATRPDPHSIFGLDVSDDEFAKVSANANLPVDRARFFFTPTVVNTGDELVLFDTGLDAAGIAGALVAAGYAPDQVDVVVLTHMHGDHIGGLTDGDSLTFPNARYVTGDAEYRAWSAMDNEGFDTKVRPLSDNMALIAPDTQILRGITAVEAFGHTPGHMAYRLDSDGQSLLLAADFANHYVWSLAHPDWEVKFDMDKAQAAATRCRLLAMLADERMPFVGYHMPWPAVGYVVHMGDGFAYVPESYQLRL